MGCFLTTGCKVQEGLSKQFQGSCARIVAGSWHFYIFHSLDSFVTSIMYETAKCFKFDVNSSGQNPYALKIVMVWFLYDIIFRTL